MDIDNTLLDFYKAESVAVKKVLKNNELPFDDKTVKLYSDINKSYWERFERGEIPKNTIFAGRFETLLKTLKVSGNPQKIADEYCGYLAEGYFKIDGADKILDYLKSRGYKLYATTNGFTFTQFRRIKYSGLEPYFDMIFVSEETGYQKPEKGYFEYVISKIPENDKSKMLIIGDSQSSDILGGINIGIDTCWFNNLKLEPKYHSKYEITDLTELKNIL